MKYGNIIGLMCVAVALPVLISGVWDYAVYIMLAGTLFFISTKNTFSTDENKNVHGYFTIPFFGSMAATVLLFLMFLAWNPVCNEGMGCGLNLLVYMGLGVLLFFLLIINHHLMRK